MSNISFVILVIAVFVAYTVVKNLRLSGKLGGKIPYKRISAKEAWDMMQNQEPLTVVDVRTKGEWANGHIKGAINIPVETIGSVKPKKLNDADMPIMVYCQSGARSSQAARRLSALGYTQIYDLGGIHRWTYGTVR